jgi:replicative DNA helicase Mcm
VVICGELKAFPLKSSDALMEPEICASSIEKLEKEYDSITFSEDELRRIVAMSTDPLIFQRLTSSIAPSVLGHDNVKRAIALQLFGGFSKTLSDSTRTRGDIHILLCGDPGVAKSQILKSVMMLSPRAVITSGTLSSAAGLTATVVKDANNQWSLEAGAAVLADRAMLIVDEIDKMRAEDRAAMHTAMEQQEIYISKAGINTTLYTRCSILAAANPEHGRFDMYSDLAEQVDLPPTLLSRFDMIFLMIDSPDKDKDKNIARFILDRDKPEQYDANIIRKYIAYSRQNIFPTMNDKAKTILVDYYTKMRGMGGRDKPMPITARQLEALGRLAEASARTRLSQEVTEEDAARVVEIMVDCLKGVAFDPMTGAFDIDKSTFMSKKSRDIVHELLDVIKSFSTEKGTLIEDVVKEMTSRKEMKRDKVEAMIEQLLREGKLISPRNGLVRIV